MFIGKLTVEHVCHSERSEESLIFSGPVAHKNKPRCFASLNMTVAIYGCPERAEWNSPHSGTQQRFFFFELACVAEIEPTTVAAMNTSTIFTIAGALLFSVALGAVAATP